MTGREARLLYSVEGRIGVDNADTDGARVDVNVQMPEYDQMRRKNMLKPRKRAWIVWMVWNREKCMHGQ